MMFACAFPLSFAFTALVYNAFSGTSTNFSFLLEFALILGRVSDEVLYCAEQHYRN